jgi:hypothetical protein
MHFLLFLILLAILFPAFMRFGGGVFAMLICTPILIAAFSTPGRAQSTSNCYRQGTIVRCDNTTTTRPPVGSPGWMDGPASRTTHSETICQRIGNSTRCETRDKGY